MGCNQICKAKKKAKKAEAEAKAASDAANAEAAEAKKQADAAKATAASSVADGQNVDQTITITSYSTEVVTIAKYLGIDKTKNTLSIREMQTLLQTASRSPQILASAAAKNLINPISTALGAYQVLDAIRVGWLIVKPVVKLAQQINDVATCNFAAIGEMIADIGQFILQILIGFAPLLIELLKNLFLNIPLYTKTITKEQSIRIQNLIVLSQLSVRQRISDSFSSFKITSIQCPTAVNALAAIRVVEAAINVAIATYVQNDPIPTLEDLTDVPELRQIIIDYIIAGLECARKKILQVAIDEVNKEEIDILQIPDVANSSPTDKKSMKEMMEGLLTVTKKIELAEAEELLRRNFSDSQQSPTEEGEVFADHALAEAAADNIIQSLRDMLIFLINSYNTTDGTVHPKMDLNAPLSEELKDEIKKNLAKVEDTREDIITLNIVEELMQSNKIQILRNVITSLKNISFSPSDYVLNDCISLNINNDFNTLRANMISNNFTVIDGYTVNDTANMETLRDLIHTNTVQAINDELIVVNDTCGFVDQVCESVIKFKSDLVLAVETNLSRTSINAAIADVPDYINPLKLTKMIKLFNTEINKEIGLAARTIVLEDILPCKSCKPCEQIKAELDIYALKRIEEIKDELIRNAGIYILDVNQDWTITDAQSIIDKKQQLVELETTAINMKAGTVDLYDTFIYRLKLEEEELLKSINAIVKNL